MAKKQDNSKLVAILSYILIGIIWYFADETIKKNKFTKFHVKQALVLLIISLIIGVVGSIIPLIGWMIILPIGQLFILILLIIGLINSINGKEKELPIIGGLADQWFKNL
jgi:uncharacterized membrane protein